MSRLNEEYASKVIISEELAKEISWYEIFDAFENYSTNAPFNNNYKSVKNKLLNSRVNEVNNNEFKILKKTIIDTESYLHSIGNRNLAMLFRAIYRENTDFKYLKDKFGGCYIATLIYGSYDKKEVLILRKFRDNILSKYFVGEIFIEFYYKNSPYLIKKLKNKKRINRFLKKMFNIIANILEKYIL